MKLTRVQTLLLEKPLTEGTAKDIEHALGSDLFYVRGVTRFDGNLFPFSAQVTGTRQLKYFVNSSFISPEPGEVVTLLCVYPIQCKDKVTMPVPIRNVHGTGGYITAPMLVHSDGSMIDDCYPPLSEIVKDLEDVSPDRYEEVINFFEDIPLTLLTREETFVLPLH